MSQRTRALTELIIGLVGLFGYFWLVYPLYHLWIKIVLAIPLLAFFVISSITNNTHRQDLGFRWDNGSDSAKILGLFTLIAIPALYGIWQMFFPVNTHFYSDKNFWEQLMIYPIWALFQQSIALGFFFRRYRVLFAPHTGLAILFSACTFALMHAPNPSLLLVCFLAGLVWAKVYHRSPNLYTTAVSHAILGALCLQVLWMCGRIGPTADVGRWSNKMPPPVQGTIKFINTQKLEWKEPLIHINREETRLVIDGWVATKTPAEEIILKMGNHTHPVEIGAPRRGVAKRFRDSEYIANSFHAIIPLAKIRPGHYPLALKVSLEGSFFNYSPGKLRWIHIP